MTLTGCTSHRDSDAKQEKDLQGNKKKLHIGNDYVAIIYNNSGRSSSSGTVKGSSSMPALLLSRLTLRTTGERCQSLNWSLNWVTSHRPRLSRIRTSQDTPRQMALHSNLAAIGSTSRPTSTTGRPLRLTNWLERLQHIKRLKGKVLKELKEEGHQRSRFSGNTHDFTEYV